MLCVVIYVQQGEKWPRFINVNFIVSLCSWISFFSLCIQMSWQFPSLLWQWHSSLSLPRCSICPPRHFWGQERRATASLWNIMDKRAAAITTAIPQNISLFSGFDMIDASVFIGPYYDHFLSCLKLTGAIETSMMWLWLLRILAQNLRLMML